MAEEPALINLKVLSPSTEIENGINLPDISASTTVRELRTRIQNEIPSKPAVERMRLIYRGRVVANDAETLADVFGLENIRNSKDQTLHLVLRELPSSTSSTPVPRNVASPAPRSATVPPNPFRPTQTSEQPPMPQPPTNPFRPAGQPRPNSQPQTPHHHHHLHHHHQAHHHHQLPQNPFGGLPLPAQVNNLFQQQIAQAMAQNLPQQNFQRIPTPNNAPGTQSNEQSRNGTPAPQNGTPVPPGGAMPFNMPGAPGSMPNMPPGSTRVIRQEAIGPNGERWTMTYNNTNITIPVPAQQVPILPRPFPHPPHVPGPVRPPGQAGDNVDALLSRLRLSLLAARQEMDNVRVLFQGPGGQPLSGNSFASVTPPSWRIQRIRQHVQSLGQNLDNVQRGLASILAEPSLAQNQDVLSLQAAANELRAHAEQLNSSLDSLQGAADAEHTPSTTDPSSSAPPSTSDTDAQAPESQSQSSQAASNTALAESGPELFLLSSPQGPVGVLFDQRGTFTTAPLVSTLPFQAFSQQFASNRQTLATLGQQIAHNTIQFPNQFAAAAQPNQNQQPTPGAQMQLDQPGPQNQIQNQDQNQNQAPAPNAPGENDRLAVIAGHMWLLFKLVCFIYIFAGGGGWYRPVMMGIVAAMVYMGQLGMFENQFNMVRQHFEALLGLPGHNQNAPAQGANNQTQGQAQGQQPAEPNRNLTPEQAAQRLLQQQHEQRFGWVRERTRTIERAFALFVASLWPGLGERMVQAQEERERSERAAEEERQRREEEARQQEAEQAQANEETSTDEKKDEPSTEEAPTERSSSGKGKERAEVAEDGPSASS